MSDKMDKSELDIINGDEPITKAKSDEELKTKSDRGTWSKHVEFILSLVGYTVGIGSVWRFPTTCMRNGGGAFLIPYLFFLVLCGGPLYYMEICLGQFTGKSAIGAFELCKIFRGLGIVMVAMSFVVLFYDGILMAWILYFIYQSFSSPIAWSTCGNWWNTPLCTQFGYTPNGSLNGTGFATNITVFSTSTLQTTPDSQNTSVIIRKDVYSSAANEFWLNNVLRRSSSLEDFGSIQTHLALSLLTSWVLICICMIKGVHSIGKVVYVTAIVPYFLLTVILIRALTLDGSIDGIELYLKPKFSTLLEFQVWLDAAIQVFYSLGPCWGGVITMASYNKFHQRNISATIIVVFMAGFTSLYGGLVVFAMIGFMAKEANLPLLTVAGAPGPGLVFVVYPEAVSRMPLPQLWGVLFFFMLITVFLDSMFGMAETVVGALIDSFPHVLRRWKMYIVVGVNVVFFVSGLPFTTNGGIYLFQLFDWYSSSIGLLFGSAVEVIILGWIYGFNRFSSDIKLMTGKDSSIFLRTMICILTPIAVTVCFIMRMTSYGEPDYGDGYKYKPYAIAIGNFLAFIPIIPLIISMIRQCSSTSGSCSMRLKSLFSPTQKWVPNDWKTRKEYTIICDQKPSFLNRVKSNLIGTHETPLI
ncbi:hypothetical protein ACJMK2_035055 [Sinanodonta woodiana]|uniref:Transporter n=1 Tax=Sinanodonta woodiana TaxID=1069815 RepID=A0ABD3WTL9_SINWO